MLAIVAIILGAWLLIAIVVACAIGRAAAISTDVHERQVLAGWMSESLEPASR